LSEIDQKFNLQYDYTDLGIAFDEVERHLQLNDYKRSLLVEKKITENMATEYCKVNGLYSPHYLHHKRDGCVLCPQAKPSERIEWFKQYPEAFELVLQLQNFVKQERPEQTPLRNYKFFIEEDMDKEFPENCEGGKYLLKGPKVGNEANWNSFVEDVGYVMCAPVDASVSDVDYTITVKSERRTVDIPVNLMKSSNSEYTENTMGKQFTILLKFNIGDNIAVSTTVDNWKTGGFSKGDITE
jgi:hypothetical protein